jgi:hypothetical protein
MNMKTKFALTVSLVLVLSNAAVAVQKEIFGITGGGFSITRYDVMANSFYNCGPTLGGKFITNLAMDNNRRLYYMHPFDASHVLYQADLDAFNNLINQQVHDTFAPGNGIIDGFTIGPDQNLYMTGYGKSEIYRYIIGSGSGTMATEVTLVNGPGQVAEFRSDLAFDPITGYLVGIGIVPDGSGRRSLFQVSPAITGNGVNDNYTWQYFGGNSSPWALIDLGGPSNPGGPLGPNPDGVAFDPTNGDLYLSGDGEKFSLWDRNTATLTSYLMDSAGMDSGMGYDLAFQTVPEPSASAVLALGFVALLAGRRVRRPQEQN